MLRDSASEACPCMIHIVLYEPEIPQNTGNIMRTCTAFGMKLHLIEPLGFYMDEKHLRRAGMDYRDHTDWTVHHHWQEFLDCAEGELYFITRYGERTPDSFDFTDASKDIYLIFGKESTGIPKEILAEHYDRCIRIPMKPDVRSLNLSNCAALIAYEVLRQQGYPGLSGTEVLKGKDYLFRN